MCDCKIPFSFLISFTLFLSILSMAWIVLIFKTFVKMKNDKIIASQIGQRLREFRLKMVSRDDYPERDASYEWMAKRFNEDHPDDPIGRGQIKQQEDSPQWEYLFWLKKRFKLNLRWAIENLGKPIGDK